MGIIYSCKTCKLIAFSLFYQLKAMSCVNKIGQFIFEITKKQTRS